MRPAAAQSQFPPAASADKPRTGQVGHCLRELPLLMAHDHDDALGKRRYIVSARAAVDVLDLSRFLHERCIDVAETIDFQRSQEPDVHNTAMNVHSHDIEKAAPACCPIPNTRIGQTHCSFDRTHVHYSD